VEGGFFAAVYQVVAAIPRGRVCTYGGVSQQIVGRSTAARTVGWALHGLSAEEAERVPWWRVVNAQGRISTSCTEHSAELQRSLLEEEGVRFGEDDRLDLYRYGWWGPAD
jgi:methylated-DNA-protein-cysteine methyltransferase-like protein